MQSLKMIAALALCFAASMSCKNDNDSSKGKEFEFSLNICQDIQTATDKRWSAASGKSKEDYHRALISQERQIIAYELPRYQQRLTDIQSNSGPANGPTSQVKPLTTTTAKTTAESPIDGRPSENAAAVSDSDGPTQPTELTSGFDLQDSRSFATDALAKEVCPGCTLEQVEGKIRVLQQNHISLSSCAISGVDPQVAAAESAATAGLTPEQQAARERNIEKIRNLVLGASNAQGLCEWWGTVASGTGASRDRCRRETIEGFCQAALLAAGSTTANILSDQSAEKITTDTVRTIPQAIKTAITGCIQQMSYDTVKQSLKNIGTSEFLPDFTKKLATQAIKSDNLSEALKAQKAAELKKQIALLVCNAGAAVIAYQIEVQPQIDYNNPCSTIFARSKSRAKACLNTTSSVCRIAAGNISLENFLPARALAERPVEALAAEAANQIAQAGCNTAGKAGSALCATISESANQIRQAITSGNNDWAHCLGTDQGGACTGAVITEYMLGVKVADFTEPVLEPKQSSQAPEYQETEVCWCDYSCYQDNWGTDTELTRSNYYTAISRGDAGKRECGKKDGRWNWTGQKNKAGYHVYWMNHGCGIYPARSKSRVGFASEGGFELKVGGKWVYKNITAESGSCPAGI